MSKLSVPGRPTNLNNSRAWAYCACSRCGLGLLGHFYSHISFLTSFSRSLGDGPIWTEILSQKPLNPKKPTTKPVKLAFILKFLFQDRWNVLR